MKAIVFPDVTPRLVDLPNGDKANIVLGTFSSVRPLTDVADIEGNPFCVKVNDKALLPEGVTVSEPSTGANPVLTGNTGIYQDEYIKLLYGVYGKDSYPLQKGLARFTGVPKGTYKVKILMSTQKVLTSNQLSGIVFEANSVEAILPGGYNPTNNNNQVIEIETVVDEGSILDIYYGNKQTWVRTGWNAIEIEKIN